MKLDALNRAGQSNNAVPSIFLEAHLDARPAKEILLQLRI